MRATVVTIETKLASPDRTLRHTITIANGRARSSDELDRWRLFDLKNNRVTFVDDLDRSYRTVSFAQLTADRRGALVDDDVPEGLPRAVVTRGATPNDLVVRIGAYERRLRIEQNKAIPEQLFAMMQASEPIATPLMPIMRAAEEALLQVRGFPVEDHAELPYGDRKMIVDRKVVSVTQADVPATLLDVNRAFREIVAPVVVAPKPRRTRPKQVVQEAAPIEVAPVTATTATETTATTAPEKPKPAVVKKPAPAKKKAAPVVKKKAPVKKKAAPVVKKKAPKKKPTSS